MNNNTCHNDRRNGILAVLIKPLHACQKGVSFFRKALPLLFLCVHIHIDRVYWRNALELSVQLIDCSYSCVVHRIPK